MQDVHDGLGGLLIQAANLARRERCSARLREVLSVALTDLRLIVSSLDPVDCSLASLLADFRHLHTRLLGHDACGYRWHVDDLENVRLGPAASLSILRVVQEALTNVARHAKATRAEITVAAVRSRLLCINVTDNGIGFEPPAAAGCGIAGMRRRAEALGGTLLVRPLCPGSSITLTVPLAAGPPLRPAG